jgi:soluble lytic murein transglycosylase-like protein
VALPAFRPAPAPQPPATLPEATAVGSIAPIAPSAAAELVIEPIVAPPALAAVESSAAPPAVILPSAIVLPPAVVTIGSTAKAPKTRLDGRSDRDGWAREASVERRLGPVTVVPETPEALKAPIARASARYGIPSAILSAAMARETGNFKLKYVYGYHVDGTGRGVAGIDKKFHPEVTDAQAFDPDFAVDWMGRYLATILKKNGGDVYAALREYNGGPNYASDRPGYQGRPVSELTRTHADAIMAHAARAIPA